MENHFFFMCINYKRPFAIAFLYVYQRVDGNLVIPGKIPIENSPSTSMKSQLTSPSVVDNDLSGQFIISANLRPWKIWLVI